MLKRCRELWPQAAIGLVCREHLGDFFRRTGLVDEIFEIRKKDKSSYKKVQQALRGREITHLISPHTSVRSTLWSLGVRASEKVTFKKNWNFGLFGHRVVRNSGLPDALRQMSLLTSFDPVLTENILQYEKSGRAFRTGPDGELSGVPPWAEMSLREELLKDRSTWMRLMEKFVLQGPVKGRALIFPGSVWATKRWTEDGFAETARVLQEQGVQVLWMGAGNETEICQRLAAQVPGTKSLAGATSLYESAILLANSDVMIGNDSASIHLAAAAETPTVAIFGPTVPEQGFRPWNSQAWIVAMEGLSCRPCGPHGHMKCPIGTHVCMKNLSAGSVLSRVQQLL